METKGKVFKFKSIFNTVVDSFKGNFSRLFEYLIPYKWKMLIAFLSLLIANCVGLAFPLFIVKLLEGITKNRDMHLLNLTAVVLVGIFLIQGLFNFLESYFLSFVGERIVYDIRTKLYKHIQSLSFDFFKKSHVGDLISRMSNDVTLIRNVLTNTIAMMFGQIIMLIGSLAVMMKMNLQLTIFMLALAPFLIFIALFFSQRIKVTSAHVQDQLAKSTSIAEEGLQGAYVVKSFGRESYETSRYEKAMDDTFHPSIKVAFYNSTFMAVMNILGFCAIVAIIWYGGRQVIDGRLNLPMITGFLIYGMSIAGSIGQLGTLFGQINVAIGGAKRIFEIFDLKQTTFNAPSAIDLPSPCKGSVTFQNVSFGYDGVHKIINGVSLDVKAGEIIALVGSSGAGKTTLLNMIMRFYDTTEGQVMIDGLDVKSLTLESLRSQIGIVPQDTILFSGTIRENLLYGRLNATESELIDAACSAGAHEFIMNLPNKYDSYVGAHGCNLSGGQRQRLAITRAILKNPRILLLDEATSALDNESEYYFQEALSKLGKDGKTTFIIAHRLSTIKIAHRVVVMDKGQIVEVGTHSELMNNNGLYSKLYIMQFRENEKRNLNLTKKEDGSINSQDAFQYSNNV